MRHAPRHVWTVLSGVAALGAVAFLVLGTHSALPPVPPPAVTEFDSSAIARGATLAAIGDCAVCHTAAGGRPYAGGRAIPTPFGAVHASNITPDPRSGLGGWSLAAFRRAMRDGIAQDGSHLYPVLPYPHFTRASDADLADLYAFLMTRAAVDAATPPNGLPFPFNVRALLAGWNMLFLHPGAWRPDPARDAQWNRGAYLVEAVAHCGACHSGRNALGAERPSRTLAGGEAEGWYAPALQSGADPAHPWTVDALTAYLRTGLHEQHGVAGGPMTAVADRLAAVPEADVRAMAVYIVSLMPAGRNAPPETPTPATDPGSVDPAEAAFAGACGSCHGAQAPMIQAGAPSLTVSAAANAPTPQSTVQAILHGIPWREGRAAPYMPAFADLLTDDQVATLAAYVRSHYTGRPAWTGIADQVRKARRDGGAG